MTTYAVLHLFGLLFEWFIYLVFLVLHRHVPSRLGGSCSFQPSSPDKYNFSTTKRTRNCRVWVNKINNNILLLNKRKKQKKTIQVKVRSEKIFLYLGGASTKIFVSRTKLLYNTFLPTSQHKISVCGGKWECSSSTVDTVRFPSDYEI